MSEERAQDIVRPETRIGGVRRIDVRNVQDKRP